MTDNGQKWAWIVAAMVGVGDVGMEVPVGLLQGPKLPDEFSARKVTLFEVVPVPPTKEDPKGGANILLVSALLLRIGAAEGEVRIRASSIAFWSPASSDAERKLVRKWSPVEIPNPEERARVLRGPGS